MERLLESRMRGNVQVAVRRGGVGVPGQRGPGSLPYRKSSRTPSIESPGAPRSATGAWISPPKYVSPTVEYQYGKDYSFKKEQQVSVLTLSGRVIVVYTGYNKHVELIQHGAEIGAAKLWYDKSKKQFYLLVSLSIERADPTPEQHTQVVGVDVGIRYLAVTSTTSGQ